MNWHDWQDSASWALILGVLTPLLTSLVQQPKWTDRVRSIVGAVVAVVVGVLTVLANGGFEDTTSALGVIAIVLVASQASYRNLWKPTLVAPKIEAATSPGPGRHQRTEVGAMDPVRLVVFVILVLILLYLLSLLL